MVQQESVTRCAQPPAEQAGPFEFVAHLLWAVLQPLATVLLNAIDFSRDLSNQNLDLPLMAERESGADSEHS